MTNQVVTKAGNQSGTPPVKMGGTYFLGCERVVIIYETRLIVLILCFFSYRWILNKNDNDYKNEYKRLEEDRSIARQNLAIFVPLNGQLATNWPVDWPQRTIRTENGSGNGSKPDIFASLN